MPTQKDFKRLVRRRMQKTGESYTSARARLLKTRPSNKSISTNKRVFTNGSAASKPDYAKLAGMSDASLKAKTGCAWDKWVKALDHVNAHTWPHGKIAEHVYEKYKISGWWAQTVAVGYERIRGLRDIGQRRGGSFEATKSRTFAVPVSVLYEFFAVSRARAKWLPGVKLAVRKANPNKSVRFTWEDKTSVEVWLTSKGPEKSAAAIQHRKLPDKESAARSKAYWGARLDALEKVITA